MATRWGVVSAGKICHDFVTAVRSLPDSEKDHQFLAVAARKIEDAEKFAQLHNMPTFYGSYEEIAKNTEVEVVYIGTIHPYHYALTKLMLESGKHVLVEKPLTMNLKQTRDLIKLARDKKLFLMEAVWSRFLPAYEQLGKELQAGSIGTVRYVHCSFGQQLSGVDRLQKKALGGGTILDLGVYCISAICMVFGGEKPQQIVAVGHLNDEGVDVSMAASLKFSEGRLATIGTSSQVTLPCELEVVGTKGKLKLPYPVWCPTQVVGDNKTHDFPFPPTILPTNFVNSSGLRYEAVEVRNCLKNGLLESSRMSHADSELLASIMDEIRRQIGVRYPEDDL